MTDRLKEIIFKKLNMDLSKVEIIVHNESIWFIDRENKYWYLELVKSGKLYWRYQFFTQFFDLFTMDRKEYEPLIKEWVELVLNCSVSSTKTTMAVSSQMVSIVLKNNESPFLIAGSIPNTPMESVLSSGITSTHEIVGLSNDIVESALNNGVTSFGYTNRERPVMVESVINNGVTRTLARYKLTDEEMESVLNNGITSSRPANKSLTIVDSVLNNE